MSQPRPRGPFRSSAVTRVAVSAKVAREARRSKGFLSRSSSVIGATSGDAGRSETLILSGLPRQDRRSPFDGRPALSNRPDRGRGPGCLRRLRRGPACVRPSRRQHGRAQRLAGSGPRDGKRTPHRTGWRVILALARRKRGTRPGGCDRSWPLCPRRNAGHRPGLHRVSATGRWRLSSANRRARSRAGSAGVSTLCAPRTAGWRRPAAEPVPGHSRPCPIPGRKSTRLGPATHGRRR